jgi:parallel beta-helix repeat protein
MRRTSYQLRHVVTVLTIALCAALLPGTGGVRAQAPAAAPPVRYDAGLGTIFVGENYTDPNLAGNPSQPGAPKSPITIPQIAAALANPALLQDQGGGAWLLQANMVINATARLDATSASIGWLRLDSTPNRTPAYVSITANGGYLNIQNIMVTSWQTISNGVDLDYSDGRSYLLARNGGRMDVVASEVAYLGYTDGEPSGMSWRGRGTANRPETGSTGKILNSNIHDNYFGQYAFAAYGLVVTNNEFHHNVSYGFDPHDGSTGFQVSYNRVYDNGKHGIIFSRNCTNNLISHNEVFNNAQHGIMMDRGSNNNTISDNLVYGNDDGIAIFESSNNLIQNNQLHDNARGIRVNATYDQTDTFDGISTNNTIVGNTIDSNTQYGIYLYERADRNTIKLNRVANNAVAGVYIKTGGNSIVNNDIRLNATGISIVGGPPSTFPPGGPPPVPALELPGDKNSISSNTIEDNDTTGIQLKTATNTWVGAPTPDTAATDGNSIRTNGTYGVTMNSATIGTTVLGNLIEANGNAGVLVKDSASARNRITRNAITANGGLGISIGAGANGGIGAPTITSAPSAATVTGKAAPNATIEIYRDPLGQGHFFKGAVSANGAGDWSFTLPANDNPQQGLLTAVAIAANGNTSAFGGNLLGGAQPSYTVGAGRNGELTVFVSGPTANVTLPDIKRALDVISPTVNLLEDQGNGLWQVNASLFLNRGVTLTLTRNTVTWLKLRSQSGPIHVSAAGSGSYDYNSFVTLRTYNGAILIDGVRITSWDPALNDYDRDISNGRSYLIAKYDARMDIKNADLSYLGSADGESYGVSWRDINDDLVPTVLLTRVTGEVLNSNFSYNYYGIYTFQASNMTFRNNTFQHNIGYGFDPHDFSHHFTIEDNQSFANGNHGFIISRGCNNFVFRRNKSYDNHYTIGTDDRRAHGFIIDPGSPKSAFAQAPSHDNLLENNQAWGNDGYGLRILGSINNIVRNNSFVDNLQGITLEQGSTGNLVQNNTITGSDLYGVYLIGGSDGNTIAGNTITQSGKHGIYIKTGKNTITQNTVSDNGSSVGGSGIATLHETTLAAAAADLTLPGARVSLALSAPDLLGPPALASLVDGNTITQNTLIHNIEAGVELKDATGTRVEGNLAQLNGSNGIYLSTGSHGNLIKRNTAVSNVGYGIRANGSTVTGNTWTENSVYANSVGGITNTSNANGGILPPTFTVKGMLVSGSAAPGATVEIFSDTGKQGRYFEGRVVAAANGAFSFTATRPWQGPNINATATDANGNSSALTYNIGQFVAFAKLYLPLMRR